MDIIDLHTLYTAMIKYQTLHFLFGTYWIKFSKN